MARSWGATVSLGGSDISNNVLGILSVTAVEGNSRTASFTYDPPSGSIDPNDWLGAAVIITLTEDAVTRTIFTGKVNQPTYNIQTGKVVMQCDQNRDELLGALSKSAIDTATPGAFWSPQIFEDEGSFEYARDRLRTVAASYDFDGLNAGSLTDWKPKVTADITFKGVDILRGSMSISLNRRANIVNSIAIKYDYRYERLRQRELDFSYRHSALSNWCVYLDDPAELCYREQIISAIDSSGWQLKQTPTYTPLPADGEFICQATIQFVMADNQRDRYCLQADFTLADRWAQALREGYTVIVKAPQSITQYGSIDRSRTYGSEAVYDASTWESFDSYSAGTGSASPNGLDNITDMDTTDEGGRTDFELGIKAAIGIARAEILTAHRKNTVQFKTPAPYPDIELTDTVEVSVLVGDDPVPTVPPIEATGKVIAITHELNIGTWEGRTDIKIALSKSQNAPPTETAINAPTAPDMDDAAGSPTATILGDYYGNHSDSPAYDNEWNGLIGNYRYVDIIGSWPQYPQEFAFTLGVISDADRQEKIETAASDFDIEIPNDILVLNR